jgi:glucose/mannose transport system substrate-binding protein
MKGAMTHSRTITSDVARAASRATALVVLGLGLFGCGAGDDACEAGEACARDGQLEVATWWGRRGELFTSFDILKQSYRRDTHRDVELAHHFEDKEKHTDWVEDELSATVPPKPLDVFAANNGDEVLHWTACAAWGDPPPRPKLRSLTDPGLGRLALSADWIAETFEPKVMETLQCLGETYAIPVGIHRINTLLYNRELFRDAGYAVDGGAGVPLPRTLEELHAAAAAVTEHLPPMTEYDRLPPSAFAVPGDEPWTLSLFAIENLMLALAADEEQYQRYWRGEECNEALLERALREFASLVPYFGSWELDAADALDRVVSGQAAMMVMGDWAMAELDAETVGAMPFPGTSEYFVFTADVYALPVLETADAQSGLAWLRSVTRKQTQREFSAAKSALPARMDIAAELASPLDIPRSWVRSLPALLPYHPESPFLNLQDELQLWLDRDQDDERLLLYARQQYPKLSHGAIECEANLVGNLDGADVSLVKDGEPAILLPEIE